MFEKIESYNFECEAGNLKNCKEWQELKENYVLKNNNAAVDKIVGKLYKVYGTDSGMLFGIADVSVTTAIVRFVIAECENKN